METKLLFFDQEALAADIANWDLGHGPCKVTLASDGYPDDPRACDPAIIDIVEAALEDRAIIVERSSPGCQVWAAESPETMVPEAGADLAKLLQEHRPMAVAGQAISLAQGLKGIQDNWGTNVRIFRMREAGYSSLIELEDLREAGEIHSIWLGHEKQELLTGCLLKAYVRDLPAGPFLGQIGDGLPELVQVAILFWTGGHTFAMARVAKDGSFMPLYPLEEGEAYEFAKATLAGLPAQA